MCCLLFFERKNYIVLKYDFIHGCDFSAYILVAVGSNFYNIVLMRVIFSPMLPPHILLSVFDTCLGGPVSDSVLLEIIAHKFGHRHFNGQI